MNTELRLFRIVDGTKKAVKITIDEDRLIVGEEYSDPVGGQSTPKDARDAALAGSGPGGRAAASLHPAGDARDGEQRRAPRHGESLRRSYHGVV